MGALLGNDGYFPILSAKVYKLSDKGVAPEKPQTNNKKYSGRKLTRRERARLKNK